ncbi:MAG: NAD(P)H-hydrate dehydratase [Clostridiales bacterium]|jgi:NAD(P)H-hydrate epimerase|nr:NAD(P)H-hydrate dehydratase [Clostridiales bacterium]
MIEVDAKLIKGLFGKRERLTHKGDYGKLAIIGGCKYYAGAPLIALSGAAALRVGAGLNVVAVPDFLAECMYSRVTESTVFPLPSSGGFIRFDKASFEALSKGVSAFCVGMGMGECSETGQILEYLFGLGIPILLDADALNFLSESEERLDMIKSLPVIVTPHAGEMSRLCKRPVEEIARNPELFAVAFAEKYGVVTLLKGSETFITDGKTTLKSTQGGPCMAKGGSGDLLSGIIGGLLAQGKDLLLSAAAGAYIAGRAASLAEAELTEYSILPTDTAAFIPRVIKEIIDGKGL